MSTILPSYLTDSHHCSDDVYLREGVLGGWTLNYGNIDFIFVVAGVELKGEYPPMILQMRCFYKSR